MPHYLYRCNKCGTEFEKFQGINSKPMAKCHCGNMSTHRLICGGGGIIFKGSWPGKDIIRKEEGRNNEE